MLYVHVANAEDHRRDIPEVVLVRRIVSLLGARASHVQAASAPTIENEAIVAS
jgi:hypothetical protein